MLEPESRTGLSGSLLKELIEDVRPGASRWPVTKAGWLHSRDDRPYIPNAGGQAEFHALTSRFRALFGGRGSGKTTAGAQQLLQFMQEPDRAGYRFGAVSPDNRHFKRSTWPELEEWIPWENVVRHHRTDQWITFDNGSQLWYGGIEDPNSWRGPNLNVGWFDEAGRKKTEEAWLVFIASVRVGPEPVVLCTSTPHAWMDVPTQWLKRYFIDKEVPEELKEILEREGRGGALYEHAHASIHENQAHLDPIYYASMSDSYVGAFAEQELGGKFIDGTVGVLAKRHWFEIVDVAPAEATRVRYWDLAATEKKLGRDDPDNTAGIRVAYAKQIFYIEDARVEMIAPSAVEALIVQTAQVDGLPVRVRFEQEPGASGKLVVDHFVRLLAGFDVGGWAPTGDKIMRAMPWLGQAKAGNVKLVAGPWNEAFLQEVEQFPIGRYDDQVDAMSGAVRDLTELVLEGGFSFG